MLWESNPAHILSYTAMKIKLIKLLYAILSIIAGLTVGLVLSLYIALIAGLQTFIMFPLQVYNNCVRSAIAKRIEENEVVTQKNEDMWERHIERMDEENKKN